MIKKEIQYAIYIFILGMGLVAYANDNFMTKRIGDLIFESLKRIEKRVIRIEDKVYNLKIKEDTNGR